MEIRNLKEIAEELLSNELHEIKGGLQQSSGCWFSCDSSCSDSCKDGCKDSSKTTTSPSTE